VKSASELSSVVFAKFLQSTFMCEVSGLEGGTATRSISLGFDQVLLGDHFWTPYDETKSF
jgi:hypothetical protein